MIQLMEERQQHEAALAEYKQVCTKRSNVIKLSLLRVNTLDSLGISAA